MTYQEDRDVTDHEDDPETIEAPSPGGIDTADILERARRSFIHLGRSPDFVDRGAPFTLSTPRDSRAIRSIDGTMGRLLVVDDDPDFGELVRVVAIKLGFEVRVADSGSSFMELYDSFRPSVVMLDVVMPDIGGIELIRWLGSRGSEANVIVVTGYSHRYGELGMKLARANGLRNIAALTKPIRLSSMRAALVETVEA